MSAETNYLRLKKMLATEKTIPQGLKDVLAADILAVFLSYFDFENKNFNLETSLNADGNYVVKVELAANRVKNVRLI